MWRELIEVFDEVADSPRRPGARDHRRRRRVLLGRRPHRHRRTPRTCTGGVGGVAAVDAGRRPVRAAAPRAPHPDDRGGERRRRRRRAATSRSAATWSSRRTGPGSPRSSRSAGLSVDFGGSWILPRLIGMHRAKELVFLADIIDAAEADRIGLVNRVVPHDELDAAVRELARPAGRAAAGAALGEQAAAEPEPLGVDGGRARVRGRRAGHELPVGRHRRGGRRVRAEAPAEFTGPLSAVLQRRRGASGPSRDRRPSAFARRDRIPVGRGDPQHEGVVRFPLGAARGAGEQERAARVGLGLDRGSVIGATVQVHRECFGRSARFLDRSGAWTATLSGNPGKCRGCGEPGASVTLGAVTGEVLLAASGAIAGLMLVTWLAQPGAARCVDRRPGVAARLRGRGMGRPRAWPTATRPGSWLLVALVTIWGLRLSVHLAWRKHGEPEDYRYQAMRKHWGSAVRADQPRDRVRAPGRR